MKWHCCEDVKWFVKMRESKRKAYYCSLSTTHYWFSFNSKNKLMTNDMEFLLFIIEWWLNHLQILLLQSVRRTAMQLPYHCPLLIIIPYLCWKPQSHLRRSYEYGRIRVIKKPKRMEPSFSHILQGNVNSWISRGNSPILMGSDISRNLHKSSLNLHEKEVQQGDL